jgi:hypothetical protein
MRVPKRLGVAAVILATAATLASAAWAAGEPKNEQPFVAAHMKEQWHPFLQGEAKNMLPFNRPTTVLVSADGGGFDWADGGIGAAAGIGIALAGAGAALLLARRPTRTA